MQSLLPARSGADQRAKSVMRKTDIARPSLSSCYGFTLVGRRRGVAVATRDVIIYVTDDVTAGFPSST